MKTLLTTGGCELCDKVKKKLDEKDINYIEIKVKSEVKNKSTYFVPTIIDEKGNKVIGKDNILKKAKNNG